MRSSFLGLAAAAGLAACAAESGGGITIPLPGGASAERTTIAYECNGTALSVDYINAGSTSLAVFAHQGETVVASNVVAASGARYAGGRYIWWTQGPEASLYDATQGENAAPIMECRQNA